MGRFLLVLPLLLFAGGAGPSLKDLSDDSLRVELADDGLNSLLERAFVVDNIPADQRGPERAVIALHELADPNLTATQRTVRLHSIVSGISSALGNINNPDLLLSAASIIVKQGVEGDVNVIEYFGEDSSDVEKARLQPVVNTAAAMYERAVQLLDAKQTQLQDKIVQPGDAAAQAWQKVYQRFQTATYTRWMLAYSQALAMDPADQNRAKLIDDAITNLKQWDNSDSGVQPVVEMQIAKLHMISGAPSDLKTAKELLHTIDASPDSGVADRYTLFNAYYFTAVCDILRRDAAAAQSDADQAEVFRQRVLAGVVGEQYAMDMLHYRLALLNLDQDGAVKILEDLSARAPGLRPVIAAHLLGRLPANPDVSTLEPLLLSALVQRAWTESASPAPDASILQQGLAAANQYLALADKGDPRCTSEETIDASKIRGVLLKTQGHLADAAAAYLDHAQRYKDDVSAQAPQALNDAIVEVAQLLKNNPADSAENQGHQSELAALEDRLLSVAVDSFARNDLAYEYARRLQRSGKAARAAEVFDLVPRDDPNAFNALFFKMVALNQRLDAPPSDTADYVSPEELPAVITTVQSLADQVIQMALARQSAGGSSGADYQDQSMRVRAILLAADVAARRGHDPGRALSLLKDIPTVVAGLPDARQLLAEGLNLKVVAFMSAGQSDAATGALVQYLNTVGGDEGLQTVYNLLTRLNRELDRAQIAGDSRRVRELADDRAALTPFLVKWAQANSNPDISKFTYRYLVFDAATQRQAAELQPDPGKRAAMLHDALSRFKDLQSADNVQLYQASLPPDADSDTRDYPDPTVMLGLGETAFDLGDWQQAHDSIGRLLADSRLGDGTTVIKNAAGQDEIIDNDQFWEAQYDFIYATAELARDPASGVTADIPRTILGRLSAIWQDRLGGAKWHGKFEELAKDVAAAPH